MMQVTELTGTTGQAAAVWRFLIDIDLHPRLSYEVAIDEPLPYLLLNARAVRSTVVHRLCVQLVDVDRPVATPPVRNAAGGGLRGRGQLPSMERRALPAASRRRLGHLRAHAGQRRSAAAVADRAGCGLVGR